MAVPQESSRGAARAVRTGVAGMGVAAFAFFDGVFVGAPVAVLAGSFQPLLVFVGAFCAVALISMACCRWLDHRWDEWLVGHGARMEHRLESLRASRLMRAPMSWIQFGSDRRYALAAAIVNPVLVVALVRSAGDKPVGEHRVVLGSIAFAIPYVAMWTLVGITVGGAVRAF